jgi:hypothetical protein
MSNAKFQDKNNNNKKDRQPHENKKSGCYYESKPLRPPPPCALSKQTPGKTYTIMGAELHHSNNNVQSVVQQTQSGGNSMFSARGSMVNSTLASPPQFHFDGPLAGIIPRAARAVFDLFDRIQRADAELVLDIKMFFVEIYVEHVRDLLEPSRTNLNVRKDPSTTTVSTSMAVSARTLEARRRRSLCMWSRACAIERLCRRR